MYPDNLLIIPQTNMKTIVDTLYEQGITGGHFTNGTYVAPASVVVPTTLAGFEYVVDHFAAPDDALFVLLNSDVSMGGIMSAKNASADEIDGLENQQTRAEKVLRPVALQHPNRTVVGLFYHQDTPKELYDYLAVHMVNMKSLYKFGYGTMPDAPRIEGAHNFTHVLAFPFLNDDKPLCYNLTIRQDQSDVVKVIRLQDETPAHKAYMRADGTLSFALAGPLAEYGGSASHGGASAPVFHRG